MADVFISYSSQDRLRIKPLAEALEARGFSVWWDRSLGAGDDYTSLITRELAVAKAVIVVWTDNSANSTFVRDEAGRARDDGRLIPVMLDRVQIPLGFGAFQAEDFTRWNERPEAPQMQLLEESVRARVEGRAIDGGAVAAKRRRLMTRIRLVSVLGVVAAVAVIAFVGNEFINPDQPVVQRPDHGAQLLDLVNQGKLSPEQAIELARLLENGALGEQQSAALQAPGAAPAPMDSARPLEVGEAEIASVSQVEFDTAARLTYRDAMAELLQSPDASVRQAALELSDPTKRDAAMQTLWAVAQQGGPNAAAIYKVCGAVGEANDHPLGLRALEQARNANPQDAQVWRMLSYGLERTDQGAEARGAALVGAGLAAQAEGDTAVAEQRLEAALPNLESTEGRAFVEGALGDAAAQRSDWSAASRRYNEALNLRRRAPENAPAAAQIQVDAQKLVRALDRDGRTNEACRTAQEVQTQDNVAAGDAELAQRCQRFRIQIRPGTLQRGVVVTPRTAPATGAQ